MQNIEAVISTQNNNFSSQIEAVKAQIFDALKGKFLTLEMYLVILTLLVSFSVTPTNAQEEAPTCDTNELNVVEGQELLPTEISVEEIQRIYQVMCNRMNRQYLFDEGDVQLMIKDLPIIPAPVNDIAYAYVAPGSNGGIGMVGMAFGASQLSRNGDAWNPTLWRIILGHEFAHLFGADHGAEGARVSNNGVHGGVISGKMKGLWDAYWWELIMQYVSANRCDIINTGVGNEPELAQEICEEIVESIEQ